ncbi:MAG: ABC transporter permease [Chloroflexi bacterium]|nr:MAG: ABC transporter permease [Chloroflexota bacterium]
MGPYVIRRLALSLPSLILVSFIIFSLLRILPGDVVMARIAESGYASPETLQRMREQLGLDRNFFVQYFDWAFHAVQGDFGRSLWTNDEVLPTLLGRMRVSAEIAVLAVLTAVTVAIPLGVVSAVKQNTRIDYAARFFSIMGLSVPDFFLATMLVLVLSKYVGWLPEFGWYSPLEHPLLNLQALIFPALIIGYRLAAVTARMTRSAMLEVMREDFVRTAHAKGLRARDVVIRHVLRNSLLPVVTIIGAQLTGLLGGLVVIEQIFSLPGLGRLTLDAVTHRDYTQVQGSVMVMATIFVMSNLAIDLTYVVLDPRIRYR